MPIPDIESGYSDSFKRIVVSGMFGSVQPIGLNASVYSEYQKVDKVLLSVNPEPTKSVIRRVIECELIIDPMQMKSIYLWLKTKIEEYERIFGTIPSPEEIESKFKRDFKQ